MYITNINTAQFLAAPWAIAVMQSSFFAPTSAVVTVANLVKLEWEPAVTAMRPEAQRD